MDCIKPIRLKNGLYVPCGKCELCQSQNRTEKSVLIQLHSEAYNRMPLFVTLTYAPQCLPLGKHGYPTLLRSDLSEFLKRYKRDFSLTCDRFTYFGCGEYGDEKEHTFRAHYHLIWFGDDKLHDMWLHDVHFAENFMFEQWKKGYVDVCEAQWSGMHYVTKYVLKDEQQAPSGSTKPFCVTSNGIGNVWLQSLQASKIREQLHILMDNRYDIYDGLELDHIGESIDDFMIYLKSWQDYLRPFMPDFRITLPSGSKAYLPRKLRRKLVGSFEFYWENPMYFYNKISEILQSLEYWKDSEEYDRSHETPLYMQNLISHVNKIRENLSKKRFNKRSI